MKILILNYEFPPLGGGAGVATKNILNKYKDYKNFEFIFLTSSLGKHDEYFLAKNIKIIRFNILKRKNYHKQKNIDLLIYFFKALSWSLLNRNKYNIIHAFFGIPCGLIALLTFKPYIVSLRGSDVPFYNKRFKFYDKFFFQYLSRIIWRKARCVIANSRDLQKLAYKTYNKKEIKIVPNGVNFKNIHKTTNKKNFTVISTSRLTKRKRIDLLIKAFNKFSKNKNNIELRIFGSGEQEETLKKIAGNNLDSKIKFYGRIENENIPIELSKSNIFVLPSENEGMSNSLLEAMASGLAIIATNVGDAKHLIKNKGGIIVKKDNYKEITSALNKLYLNRELIIKMGNFNRKVIKDMSWYDAAKKYMSIYELISKNA